MRILGVNAIFHDPSAALVVDGAVVAAAEEERFSRRKHGKRPVPFSAWELPEQSMRWCLDAAGLRPEDLDAVAYSFDPALVKPADEMGLASQELPHSLGLLYESVTEHLGFLRSSDEYKVMALASYGKPAHIDEMRELVHPTGDGGFVAEIPDWSQWAPPRVDDGRWDAVHADLAASVQAQLEEVLVELASWLHAQTGDRVLTMAGGTALNCVANSRIWRETPFDEVWVQPAAGDAGTSLGAALQVCVDGGAPAQPMPSAALGRGWTDDQLAAALLRAAVPFSTPSNLADEVAGILAGNGVVGWFDGRSEYGPRALGHRSLLAHPGHAENLERLNEVKGREQFRPVAPMVLASRAP